MNQGNSGFEIQTKALKSLPAQFTFPLIEKVLK